MLKCDYLTFNGDDDNKIELTVFQLCAQIVLSLVVDHDDEVKFAPLRRCDVPVD